MKQLFLVDGSSIFYRAFFALIRNPLINSKGENTSATYGFMNSILKILKEEKPDYIAIIFDTKEPTFRHDMYKEYKSTRAKMPDELVSQLPRIRQAVEALNVASFELVGYEADDIVATIARKGEKEGLKVWCVTGDKDYFQLVNENIHIYTPKKLAEAPERYGPAEVKEKFGVGPELVIDKLALMGDTSDNVPGVPGVGPKTADTLLEEFGSLDGVLSSIDKVKAKGIKEKLAANVELARLSRKLVTLHDDVPIKFTWDEIARREFNYEAAKKLCIELEFPSLLKQLMPTDFQGTAATSDRPVSTANYKAITTLKELQELVKKLSQGKELAVDTETTSLDALTAKLVGVSLSNTAGEAFYIPVGHTVEAGSSVPWEEAKPVLKTLLENPQIEKFGQNIKYDYHVLQQHGITISPVSFDTMVAGYVLDPSGRQNSLDFLALKHFDYQMQPITDLIGTGKNAITFDHVPVDKATFYAAEDADYTYRLRAILAPAIETQGMKSLYYDIELPLIRVLADMESSGIKVDTNFLGQLSSEMEGKLKTLEKEIYKVAGSPFNINSTQQLSHILFEKLALPHKGKTAKKTGYSTDASVLEELAKIHPFPKFILDYRQLSKLKSTYIDSIPLLTNPNTGRIHTSFNQAVAATGRLASSDPNLQNIPIRTEEGSQIRKAFVPRSKDYVLLAADYSQIELRILAHYAQDEALIAAFKNNEDIHKRTAAEVFSVPLEQVTSEMRRSAKTANFAIIYGVTAFGLSQQTEMTVETSKEFIEKYFSRYPGIKGYLESTKKFARDNGYVTTLYGRKRYLPEINDKNFTVRSFAERTAINTPIQGTAADIIKLAMLTIHKQMNGLKSAMVLQVHDELVFDVHRSELEQVKGIVKSGMENAAALKVPLVADIGVGENWLEAK